MSCKDNKDYSIAGRYRTVRKHLDALGYKQALSLDSLPLIELLLVDLAQTKETLKHFQSIAKDNLEACSQLQVAIDPYKCDNAKLVQECNKIHLELIETKEENQKLSNDYKKKIRKLESELSDLQLSFSKNLQRIKQLETESSNKSKKISELLGKCCKPIVNNVNLATKKRACYPLRRPVLEAESLPRTSNSSTTMFSTKRVEPYVVDFVSMADHRISSLNNEVTKLKEELFLSNEHIETLKSQLNSKEKEMSRLRKLLEGGRPCTSINKDHCCVRPDKRGGDNGDILSLQQAKLNLEQQLKEALNKQHDAMAQAMKLVERNEELEKELKDIDRAALMVEADCNSTVKENNRRVCRLQEKLEDVMTQVHVLESELTVQRREAQELRADLEACRLEKSSVQRTLETTLEEKKQMTDRINNLTIMESNLNGEISQLRKEYESQKNKIRELEQINQSLEKKTQVKPVTQRSVQVSNVGSKLSEKQEKFEVITKKKFIRKPITASKTSDKTTNNQEKRSQGRQNEGSKSCSCRNNAADKATQSNIDRIIHDKNVIIESLQNTIERLETERDHYRTEYTKFEDELKKDTEKDNDNMWSQICELRAQLCEKEHAISKLIREKKELCQEKFSLEDKLVAYQAQLNRSSSPCNYCRNGRGSPPSDRKKIERLEHERDTARADVERLIEERDAIRDRLKLATETQVAECRRLRESLAESEERLTEVQRQRRELLISQGSRRAALSGLDDQLEDMKEELRRSKQELTEQRTQYFQLRSLQDQTDQALGDLQGQLTQCENELSAALDRNKNLERQQLQLDNQIKELRQEINTHRSKMAQLDREKDQLLMDLDEKTEKIAALERELVFKEQQSNNMEEQIRDLSRTKQICIDQAADMERQMRSMQLDMDNLQRQLQSATMDRETAIQENRRLADDLAAVSCEVRNLYKDLEASKAEAHDLKRQLQTYVSEVRRAEDLLSQKENERTEMLSHFRDLSLEATVLENNNHSLESELTDTRSALHASRDQIMDLERQLSDKESLIRGYESQITELTTNIASLEIQVQTAQEQRMRAEDDLRTVRDLCMTLEQQKECLSKRLDENIHLKTEYEFELQRYKSEQGIFQDQMNKDHISIDRLEKMLEDARRETMTAQSNSRELQHEVARLKCKISDLQNKLSTETSELRKYQTQAAEYSKQISELRRQVTNERFDRARIQEENQSDYREKRENACQTRQQPKGCQCGSERSSGIADWNQQSNRYSRALVPKNRAAQLRSDNDDSKVSCTSCACSSDSDKMRIIEIPDDDCCCSARKSKDDAGKCCGQRQLMVRRKSSNFQTVNRMCFCSGKTRIGDIMASAKEDKCGKQQLDLQNELLKKALKTKTPSSSGVSSYDGSPRCGRCGGKKKQKQSCVRNGSSSWIMETMNIVNRMLEERRRARNKCASEKPKVNEVPVNKDEGNQAMEVPKIKMDEESNTLKAKQQSIKYSLIETSTHSTQTLESIIITVSDVSKPHLLKILAEIQQYAKSIEDYFYRINESMKRSRISNVQHNVSFKNVERDGNVHDIHNVQNIVPSQNVQSTLHPPNVQIVKTTESAQNLQALQDIQDFPSLKEDQRTQETHDTPQNISRTPKAPNTPPFDNILDLTQALAAFQGREDEEIPSPPELSPSIATSLPSLPNLSLPTDFVASDNTSVSDDFYVSDLDQAPPFASTPRDSEILGDSKAESADPLDQPLKDGDADSMEHLALSKAQKEVLRRQLQDSDADSTDYTPLPKQLDRRQAVVYEESLVEQFDDVAADMETIQQKIERLRRDIFSDYEESSHSRDRTS